MDRGLTASITKSVTPDDKICESIRALRRLQPLSSTACQQLEPITILFRLWHRACQLRRRASKKGRAETIRATGAVLIASVLLSFLATVALQRCAARGQALRSQPGSR